jgi:hypothetical protein
MKTISLIFILITLVTAQVPDRGYVLDRAVLLDLSGSISDQAVRRWHQQVLEEYRDFTEQHRTVRIVQLAVFPLHRDSHSATAIYRGQLNYARHPKTAAKLKKELKKFSAALDILNSIAPEHDARFGTDILAAVEQYGTRRSRYEEAASELVIYSDMIQESRECMLRDLYRSGQPLSGMVEQLLHELTWSPEMLSGVRVIIIRPGGVMGAENGLSAAYVRFIDAFWQTLFTKCGAKEVVIDVQ